eukprot:scaffold57018_cov48-Phaeocystis_antarctica.AAC.2
MAAQAEAHTLRPLAPAARRAPPRARAIFCRGVAHVHKHAATVPAGDAHLIREVGDVEPTLALERKRDAQWLPAEAATELELQPRGLDGAWQPGRTALAVGQVVRDVEDDTHAILRHLHEVPKDGLALVVDDEVLVQLLRCRRENLL